MWNQQHNDRNVSLPFTTNSKDANTTTAFNNIKRKKPEPEKSLTQQQQQQQQLSSSSSSSLLNCSKCNKFDQFIINVGVDSKIICLCDLFNCWTLNTNNKPSMLLDNPEKIYQYINRCRRWIKVWSPPPTQKIKEFSVTSYNILAQNLLLNHLGLYQSNNKSDLEWLARSRRLKKELSELDSDIFCLQEVHMENFTKCILPSLKERGYQAIFKQKTGQNFDGCSILFKKNKFQLQDSLEIQMNRLDISHLLDKDQIALLVKLRPLQTNENKSLIVANTHLIFNPKRGDIKLAQLRLLLAEIQRFSRTTKNDKIDNDPYQIEYFPIILCGDFNSEPNSPLIQFIETGQFRMMEGMKIGYISGQREGLEKGGRLLVQNDLIMNGIDSNSCYTSQKNTNSTTNANDGEDVTIIRHPFKFKSAYPNNPNDYDHQLISMSTYYDSGLVDHMFYSDQHKNLRLSAFKRLMYKNSLEKIGTMPNSILGSDHFSLSAKFYLT